MNWRSFGIKAALVVGIALGVTFGLLAQSAITSAQAQPQAQAAQGGSLWDRFLDQLAAALNIQRATLDSAVSSAGSSTVDAAVADGTLTQEQGDALKRRIQAGDLGALWGGRGGRGGPGGREPGGVRQALVDAAASTLGITTDELHSALHDGQTLAELAQAHNTTEQAVIDAALVAARTRLDQAVAGGTLTQAQADAIYSQLQQRGANLFAPGGRGHGWGGPGRPGAPQAPQTAPTGADT